MRAAELLREAGASARSQPVASALSVFVITGMVLVVLLTTGRTVGAERQVLASIDSAGTRSIVVRAEQGAGINADVLDRVSAIEGIEWAGAFSAAADATNDLLDAGTRVPTRYAYSRDLPRLGVPATSPLSGELAYLSPSANDLFGFADAQGSIALTDGRVYGVGGSLTVPDFLRSFEPLVLIPQYSRNGSEPVNVIVIIADHPSLVAPVSTAVASVLGAVDPNRVTVQTSDTLAQLRGLVQDQLGSFSRGLVLALLATSGVLVAALLYGLVTLRRKDFGRRRALGATKSFIVALLVAQTGLLAIIGVALGTAGGVISLLLSGDPLPGPDFIGALAVLSVVTATTAALLPATVASRREPIRELRVP